MKSVQISEWTSAFSSPTQRVAEETPAKRVQEKNVKQTVQRVTYIRTGKSIHSLVAKKIWLRVVWRWRRLHVERSR